MGVAVSGRVSILAILAATLVLSGCASGQDPDPTPAPVPTPSPTAKSEAEAYCAESGGTVQQRQPTFGTNNDPSMWVELGDPVTVCEFEAVDDGSKIYVDLTTLSSTRPTLAALAYLSKTPIPEDAPGNPANALCSVLGGTESYGSGIDGGGLVRDGSPDDVVAVCVFADGSFIDEWGIGYYASDVVRGADLAEVFRFDASELPPLF